MKVTAVTKHTLDGSRYFDDGDEYEVNDAIAELLLGAGLVRQRELQAKESKFDESSDGRYKRRDVRAEK